MFLHVVKFVHKVKQLMIGSTSKYVLHNKMRFFYYFALSIHTEPFYFLIDESNNREYM